MRSLIDPIATKELARSLGIPSDDASLYAEWLAHASASEKYSAQAHLADPSFKQQLVDQQLQSDVMQRMIPRPTIDEADALAFYRQHLQLYARSDPQVHVREIVVSSSQSANALQAKLDGGASFSQLAASYSVDSEYYRARGGDLGWMGVKAMPPEWVAHALALQHPGQAGPVFELWGKFYILQCIDAPDYEPWPYSAVHDQVIANAIDAEMRSAFDKLLKEREAGMDIVVDDVRYQSAVDDFHLSL